jgi:hypothetical protein
MFRVRFGLKIRNLPQTALSTRSALRSNSYPACYVLTATGRRRTSFRPPRGEGKSNCHRFFLNLPDRQPGSPSHLRAAHREQAEVAVVVIVNTIFTTPRRVNRT